jgi:hypothetical protein
MDWTWPRPNGAVVVGGPSAWAHNLRDGGVSPDGPPIDPPLIVEWLRTTEGRADHCASITSPLQTGRIA